MKLQGPGYVPKNPKNSNPKTPKLVQIPIRYAHVCADDVFIYTSI